MGCEVVNTGFTPRTAEPTEGLAAEESIGAANLTGVKIPDQVWEFPVFHPDKRAGQPYPRDYIALLFWSNLKPSAARTADKNGTAGYQRRAWYAYPAVDDATAGGVLVYTDSIEAGKPTRKVEQEKLAGDRAR
jgi:hypothetical protein